MYDDLDYSAFANLNLRHFETESAEQRPLSLLPQTPALSKQTMISLVKTSVRYDAQLAVVLCLNSDIPSMIKAKRENIESIWKAVKVVVETVLLEEGLQSHRLQHRLQHHYLCQHLCQHRHLLPHSS